MPTWAAFGLAAAIAGGTVYGLWRLVKLLTGGEYE